MDGFCRVFMENCKHVYVCDCGAYNEPFQSTTVTTVKTYHDVTHGVPKHVWGDFVYVLCINFSPCKFAFIS